MSVFVVIRGIRNPTVAGSSIIEGKGCDVTFLAWCYGLPSFGIIGHSVEDLLNETEKKRMIITSLKPKTHRLEVRVKLPRKKNHNCFGN
jgi:riboflavin synthase